MDVNTNFQKVAIEYVDDFDQKQVVLQSRIDTSNKNGIKQIVFTQADAFVTNYVVDLTTLSFNGYINIKVVYLDSQGMLDSFDYISDFSDELTNSNLTQGTKVFIDPIVEDIDASIQNGNIVLQTVINVGFRVLVEKEIDVLKSVDSAYSKTSIIYIPHFIKEIEEETLLSDEYNTGVQIDKIIYFNSNCVVLSTSYVDTKMIVEGQANVNILYSSESIVTQKNIVLPFVYEIPIDIQTPKACLNAYVSSSKIYIQGDDSRNIIKVELLVNIKGNLMQLEEMSIVDDLHSPVNELQIYRDVISYRLLDWFESYKERVNGSVSISDENRTIKRIDSCNVVQNTIVNIIPEDGKSTIEGLLIMSVIFEDDKNELDSMQIEIPYSLEVDSSSITPNCELFADALVDDITCRIKRDREIEIGATIITSLCKSCYYSLDLITKVEVGNPKVFDDAVISIYFPEKGETLWDISKALGTSLEDVENQNKDLKKEMDGGERVIIYRSLSL